MIVVHKQTKMTYTVGQKIKRADDTVIPENTRMARKLRSLQKDFQLSIETQQPDLLAAHEDRFQIDPDFINKARENAKKKK